MSSEVISVDVYPFVTRDQVKMHFISNAVLNRITVLFLGDWFFFSTVTMEGFLKQRIVLRFDQVFLLDVY